MGFFCEIIVLTPDCMGHFITNMRHPKMVSFSFLNKIVEGVLGENKATLNVILFWSYVRWSIAVKFVDPNKKNECLVPH